MVTTQKTSLPYDIQGRIIEDLWEDLESLAVCSLVSFEWSERARMLLFSSFQAHISYNTKKQEQRTKELMAFLGSPHSRFGQYIQRVFIEGPDDPLTVTELARRMHKDVGYYDMLFSALQAILPHLSNVHTLTISHLTWYWIPQDGMVQMGAMSMVKCLHWTCIHVDRMDDFIQFSRENFPALETLGFSKIAAKEVSQFNPTALSQLPNRLVSLRTLIILVEEATVPLVLVLTTSTIPTQNIETVIVEVRDVAFFGHVDSLLKAIGPSLTTLTIWVNLDFGSSIGASIGQTGLQNLEPTSTSPDFAPDRTPFSLGANVNLRSLHLFGNYYPWETSYWKEILRTNQAIHELVEIRLLFAGGSLDRKPDFSLLEDALLVQGAPNVRITLLCCMLEENGLTEAVEQATRDLSKVAQLSVVSTCWDVNNPWRPLRPILILPIGAASTSPP